MKKSYEFRPAPGRKWVLEVRSGKSVQTVRITPPRPVTVTGERHDKLQEYNMNTAPWCRTRLDRLISSECTSCFALIPESFVLTDEKGKAYRKGPDYYLDEGYGTFMRQPKGKIPENGPVFASYQFFASRLDSIVLLPDGSIVHRPGVSHIAAPHVPELAKGEKRIANIFFTGHTNTRLTGDMIYPITENGLPKVPSQTQFLPKTMKKLKSGKKLRILVWGDSVTECTYLPEKEHYQILFLKRLQKMYPAAKIEMRSFGWGGRCTKTFLDEPAGSRFNYAEQLLAWKPDLVISEFVNDCGMAPETYEPIYGKILKDFRAQGIEWMILTPHYIKLDWMGLTSQKNCVEDPRPQVQFLRRFAAENKIALADASKKYGHLWLNGIPFMVFMVNTINHPDLRGMKIFADALIEAVTEKE